MSRLNGYWLWVAGVAFALAAPALCGEDIEAPPRLFEARYRAWRQEMDTMPPAAQRFQSRRPVPELQPSAARDRLLALGVASVPILMERCDEYGVESLLESITKWRLHWDKGAGPQGELVWLCDEFPDVSRTPGGPSNNARLIRRWWEEAEVVVPRLFAVRYGKWKELKAEGAGDEVAKVFKRLLDLGVWALPLIMERLTAGEVEMVPAISYLTDGAISKEASIDECKLWWEQHRSSWLVPPAPKDRLTRDEMELLKGWLRASPSIEGAAQVATVCMRRFLAREKVVELVVAPAATLQDNEVEYRFGAGFRLAMEFGQNGYATAASLGRSNQALAQPPTQGVLTDQERETLKKWSQLELGLGRAAEVAAICVKRRLNREQVLREIPRTPAADANLRYVMDRGSDLVLQFDDHGKVLSAIIRQP